MQAWLGMIGLAPVARLDDAYDRGFVAGIRASLKAFRDVWQYGPHPTTPENFERGLEVAIRNIEAKIKERHQ